MKRKLGGYGGDAIYKRGRSWVLDFRYKGERHKITLGPLPNRSAAKEVATKRRGEIIAQGHGIASRPAPSLSLEKAAKLFTDWTRVNRRPETAKRYESALKPVLSYFAGKRLADISPFGLEAFKKRRVEEGVWTGLNRELEALRNLFNRMIAWGKATDNPVRKVKRLKEPEGRTRWLTVEEINRLLAACNPHVRPAVLTTLHTGLRRQELLGLKAGDLDFARRTVTVQAAYSKNGERRSIPMNVTLTQTLRPLIIGKASDAPVFQSRKGEPYRSLRTAFTTACKKAGITNCRWHDLRHTYASQLVMAGVDLPTVKELLGHKSIEMTLRYSHLSQDHKRQAVERLAEKIGVGFTPDFTPPSEERSSLIKLSIEKIRHAPVAQMDRARVS